MNFASGGGGAAKAWRDIWGCGQGVGAVHSVVPAGERVAELAAQYQAARRELDVKTSLFRLPAE
jgi:nitronate monooxygenase